ncbi:MAG TPA: GTPase ObgE, partial [Desulfotomaculum sp.]|nr:GTPase ObgE [Desulfotomaculum sp.]
QPQVDIPRRVTKVREESPFTVISRDGIFIVEGKQVEKLVAMTDLNNRHSLDRLQKIFDRMGLERALQAAGIKEGDTVQVGKYQFTFYQ